MPRKLLFLILSIPIIVSCTFAAPPAVAASCTTKRSSAYVIALTQGCLGRTARLWSESLVY